MIYDKNTWLSEMWLRYRYAIAHDDLISAVNFLSRTVEDN